MANLLRSPGAPRGQSSIARDGEAIQGTALVGTGLADTRTHSAVRVRGARRPVGRGGLACAQDGSGDCRWGKTNPP